MKWTEFYEQVLEIPMVAKLKGFCELNNIQFEPYARNSKTNELECTCCYYGDIEDGDYISIKIGDNGSFEKYDNDDYGNDIEKDLEDLLDEYERELESNYCYISWEMNDKNLELLKKEFKGKLIFPKDQSECIRIGGNK